MNNKELTELKREFDKTFPYLFSSCDGREGYDAEVTQDVWNFFLPHLKSNDEIRREVVENFKDWVINRQTEDGYKYEMWYEYIEEYLTQKENNE